MSGLNLAVCAALKDWLAEQLRRHRLDAALDYDQNVVVWSRVQGREQPTGVVTIPYCAQGEVLVCVNICNQGDDCSWHTTLELCHPQLQQRLLQFVLPKLTQRRERG